MIGLLLPLAFAADPQIDAPDVLPIELPATGFFRVPLPPDVVGLGFAAASPASPDDYDALASGGTRHLALRDAAGNPVPFVTLTTDNPPTSTTDLDVFPVDTHVWRVGPTDNVVEQLKLDFADDLTHPLDVLVEGVGVTRFASGTVGGEAVTIQTVTVPAGHGPWIVRADAHLTGATGLYTGTGLVPPTCESLPAGDPTYTEDDRARYVVALPGARWVRSVDVETDEALFRRDVWLRAAGRPAGYGDRQGTIRSLELSGARLHEVRIPNVDLATDQLVVDVANDHGRVLPVRAFTVCSVAAELLVKDPGTGPFALYVGGQDDAASTDLAGATAEVRQSAEPREPAGPLAANAAFVPREEREGVDALAAPLPTVKWPWQRPILGSGWVRIPLDQEVLARTLPDYGDLRIVDAQDRQVPYVLRRTGGERPWATGALVRTEEGASSLIRVPLGDQDATVASVTLETDRSLFHRRVVILRDRGTVTEELRAVDWDGSTSGVLSLRVDSVVGRELLVRVENGDNPPLQVSSIKVTYPEVELRAHVPEGSRLLYGSLTATLPSYDLGALADTLARRKLPDARLGPAEATTAPALGAFARIAVLGAIATLAAACFVMLARLVFATRVPDEPEAGAPEAGAPEAGAPEAGAPAKPPEPPAPPASPAEGEPPPVPRANPPHS